MKLTNLELLKEIQGKAGVLESKKTLLSVYKQAILLELNTESGTDTTKEIAKQAKLVQEKIEFLLT